MKEFYSESEAIRRAKKGDAEAQRHLYERYRVKWYMICLRYHSNKADAEDALQNGLIHIFGNLDQFDPKLGEFAGWTSRIVAHDCIILLRKKQRTPNTQEIPHDLTAINGEESAVDRLSREDLIRMIQRLPDGYRTVFNMYVFDGFTHKEIAEQLQITEGTSKSQLHKARKMLQETLEVLI